MITYIDFVAAFDSISHRFLDEALEEAEASDKSRAIFRAIYKSATAVVRVSLPGGGDKVLTDPFPVDRGVIQGDIFSPICFIIALEHLMRLSDDGGTMTMLGVLISKLEYADDAALVSKNCEEATARVTRIAVEAKERADMEVSVPKTEYMIVRKDECAGAVAEEELDAMEFNHVCKWCGMDYPTKDGLSAHMGSCEVKKHTLDEEHEVEKVLDVRGMADERFYLVKWKGWKSEFNSWRNWRDLENAMDEIDDFWETTDWIRDRPAWIEGEIRCRNCCKDRTTAGKPFKSMKSIKDHHKCRWKKPSRKGTLAEKAVIKKRRVACHDKAGTVQIEGVDLKPAQAFKYLGYKATSDGDSREAIVDRMQSAAFRYSSLGHIWKSKKIGQTLKLRLYSAAIISVLTYGCSGWELTPELLRFLNGWNGKRVAFITEREIPEECRDPTFDLVARIKLQRMKHAGDILRAEEQFLPRRILLADVDRGVWEGGLLMDTRTRDKKELIDLATRKQDWNKMCREVCGPRDYLEEHKKKKLKKQKEMEAKYQGEGGEIHGSGHGGSVKDGQFMG